MKLHELDPVFTEFIPATLADGKLYISIEYATTVHLCACGCRTRVVAPLGPADWRFTFDGSVSLAPSIGNGQYPCRSHYLIHRNKVAWTKEMTPWAARGRQEKDIALRRETIPAIEPTRARRLRARLVRWSRRSRQ